MSGGPRGKRMSKRPRKRKVRSLCFRVENSCRPTVNESRLPGKPHDHQESEKTQDTDLSEGHGSQQTVLLTDYVVGSDVLLRLHRSTAPRLFKAAGATEISSIFLLLPRVSVATIRLKPSRNSLEPHEDKLEPEPGQREHEDHVGEGEAKPRGKVDHVSVLWEEPSGDTGRLVNKLDRVCGRGAEQTMELTGSSGP